jgi:hypothetical protein
VGEVVLGGEAVRVVRSEHAKLALQQFCQGGGSTDRMPTCSLPPGEIAPSTEGMGGDLALACEAGPAAVPPKRWRHLLQYPRPPPPPSEVAPATQGVGVIGA